MRTLNVFDEGPYREHLNQIEQEGTLHMAFASKVGKSGGDVVYNCQMPFVKCRDFLNDVVFNSTTEHTLSKIYGFKTDAVVDSDKTRLVLRLSSTDEYTTFTAGIEKLNQVLLSYGMDRTTTYEINPGDVFGVDYQDDEDRDCDCSDWGGNSPSYTYIVTEGDAVFSSHTTLISFYSLLLRVATIYDIPTEQSFEEFTRDETNLSGNEHQYFGCINRAFLTYGEVLYNIDLLDMDDHATSWDEVRNPEYIHDNTGIQSFSNMVSHSFNDLSGLDYEGNTTIYSDGDYVNGPDDDCHMMEVSFLYPIRRSAEALRKRLIELRKGAT